MGRSMIFDSESGKKGVRQIVKIREAGRRQVVFKSGWHNTGNAGRDWYLGRIELDGKVHAWKEIERRYELSGRGARLWSRLRADPHGFSKREATQLRKELAAILDRIVEDMGDAAKGAQAADADRRLAPLVEALQWQHSALRDA